MNIREKILIVEDEKSIAHFISTILNSNDYETLLARSGSEAKTMISSHCPDLVILDLGLPDMDGIDVLRELRSWSSLPVVVVSARSHEYDKVQALDLGADDYLTKPFGTAELLARVRTAIRHTRTTSANSEIAREGTYPVGEMTIDYKHQVLVRGENVHLTLSEFRIVAARQVCRQVLTYDYIIKGLWGPRGGGDSQILRVNMANIRRKIEKTCRTGYLFTGSAWDIVWQRIRIVRMENGKWRMSLSLREFRPRATWYRARDD
ncbi:MAG: response regulator transcription factor [Butyricicoccus sp.]